MTIQLPMCHQGKATLSFPKFKVSNQTLGPGLGQGAGRRWVPVRAWLAIDKGPALELAEEGPRRKPAAVSIESFGFRN